MTFGALRDGCAGVSTELLLVHCSDCSAPVETENFFSDWRRVEQRTGTLVPVLWGAGARQARAPIVGFTTDQMQVGPNWAAALLKGLDSGASGAGGPIAVAPDAPRPLAVAYLTRFSAFLPGAWPAINRAKDIPGDNAAYRMEALRQHEDLLAEGMWEAEFHRRFEAEGRYLVMVPDAEARLAASPPLQSLFRQRFRHARLFGVSRVRRRRESRLRLLAAAPVVPLLLLTRIWRRSRPGTPERKLVIRNLPWLTMAAGAWALGEAVGAASLLTGSASPHRM